MHTPRSRIYAQHIEIRLEKRENAEANSTDDKEATNNNRRETGENAAKKTER